jgi:Uma2 family endonuclease
MESVNEQNQNASEENPDINPEKKREIIDGIIYNMASPSPNHCRVVLNLAFIFRAFFKNSRCEVFSELDIKFDERNIFRPDLSVICDKTKLTDKNYRGAPELVAEILSPSSVNLDKIKKPRVYQNFGVKEYWIVDIKNKWLERFVLKENVLELKAVYAFNSAFNSEVFPELQINLSDVFENVTE